MKKELLFLGFISLLVISGCTQETTNEKQMIKEDIMEKTSGKMLAGTDQTPYYEFTQIEYEKALQENKKILLYFYANWCPLCKAEQSSTFAAFNEVKNPELVGFRVNYKDSDTNEDEEALAKEFGISYQHTKIIIKNGERVLKSPETWDKQRYLQELA